jgi:hypothetical protein
MPTHILIFKKKLPTQIKKTTTTTTSLLIMARELLSLFSFTILIKF